MTRIGQPGAPLSLLVGQLAYNQQNIGTPTIPGDVLYVGDGQNVNVRVGRERQVELWGNQLIQGQKTIDVSDLKVTGGQNLWLLQTDGQGNLSFTNAPGGGLTEVVTNNTLSGTGLSTSPLGVVAETVAVAVDGVTIRGDGTTLNPLSVFAGSVTVIPDGTTISGQGTTNDPLAVIAHSVAIATTGPTLTGNGTTASPLAVVPNTVPVATNTTLTGNGTTASPLGVVAGGVAIVTNSQFSGNGTTANPLGVVAGTVLVVPDAVTIQGNGTTANPLRAVNGTVAVATDGVTIGGEGVTASPLFVQPNTVPVATNASLTGNGTTASPLGISAPVSLQNGGTGVSTSSNAGLLTALGAASSASLASYLLLAGGTMTGALTLNGNASANLQAVPFQQLNSVIAAAPYLPLSGGTLTGALSGTSISLTGSGTVFSTTAGNASIGGGLTVTGATTLNGNATLGGSATLTLSGNAAANLQAVPLQQLNSAVAAVAQGVYSTTQPSNPPAGTLWYNPNTTLFQMWSGSAWVAVLGTAPVTEVELTGDATGGPAP